jgi:SAM-dependent methyltransferase
VNYGDIRDKAALESYFKTRVEPGAHFDAQTFAGIDDNSLDFVISAHVIEHLRDPLGSIVNAMRTLKPGGVHILVVPDMRYTFDQNRPETSLEHVVADFADGGAGTCRLAYEEHLRFVHPYLTGETHSELQIDWQASEGSKRWQDFDIHFHAWTRAGFESVLDAAQKLAPFSIEAAVSVANENIFVLKKIPQA